MDSRNVDKVLEEQERSRAWLARQVGVSPSYVSRMLDGKRPLTEDFKAAAAKALGVPADVLFPKAEQAA